MELLSLGRTRSFSVYRFWRDFGYAIGALSAGITVTVFLMADAVVGAKAGQKTPTAITTSSEC